jgi:hypothetical protein
VPAAFGGTGFQPVHRTGKMPGATKDFSQQFLMGLRPTRKIMKSSCLPFLLTLNLEL